MTSFLISNNIPWITEYLWPFPIIVPVESWYRFLLCSSGQECQKESRSTYGQDVVAMQQSRWSTANAQGQADEHYSYKVLRDAGGIRWTGEQQVTGGAYNRQPKPALARWLGITNTPSTCRANDTCRHTYVRRQYQWEDTFLDAVGGRSKQWAWRGRRTVHCYRKWRRQWPHC